MCCFSSAVEDVSNTSIFARRQGQEQFIVYEMTFSAAQDIAMVLPIPVVVGSLEHDVRFINLEGYPELFADLKSLFPELLMESALSDGPVAASAPPETLEVQKVGSFEASFVPTIADFERLDARFRLPNQVWEDMPGYQDYGFAVFKLAPGRMQEVHPMAFSFPTRNPGTLFFPTVHIHDGKFHQKAHFDHSLYCQTKRAPKGWDGSEGWVRDQVDIGRARGIVERDAPCYRSRIIGSFKNEDIVVI